MKKHDRDEAGLTAAQRDSLEAALKAEAHQVAQRRRARLKAVVEAPTGGDEGDEASRLDAEELAVTLAESERLTLLKIDAALQRLARGEYGLDVETGEPIGYERLKVVPWATRAAHQEERNERARRAA
jgi:DnaK suppressor protein